MIQLMLLHRPVSSLQLQRPGCCCHFGAYFPAYLEICSIAESLFNGFAFVLFIR